jgi:hypothetical protein
VSRQHCELKCAGNRLIVRDLGSSNGTLVNGTRVKQKELKSGDTLGVGPITFIVQLGDAPVSPGDTARPVAAAAQDAADFVVGEETQTADLGEFVAEEAGDEGDFVVAEPAADDEADFVVADSTDDTEIGDVADFVSSDEPATQAETDFVVAAEVEEEIVAAETTEESETVHNMNVKDVAAKRKSKAAPGANRAPKSKPAATPELEEAEVVAEEAIEEKPKKAGLFGRLFKRKDKKPAKAEPAAKQGKGAKNDAAPPAKPSPKSKAATPEPVAAPATDAADDDATFFVSDDNAAPGGAKPVGEDELADFLMGLNEKDQ